MGAVLRSRNLAADPAIARRCKEELAPLIQRTRRERQLLTQQWLRYDNLAKCRHDSDAYHGRLRAYLSVGHRVLENWATKLKNDLFPDSGKWFKITPESRDSEDGVAALEALFRRFLWDYMRVRRKSGIVLRQLVTLGTSPIDIGWRYAERDVPTLQRIYDDSKGNLGRAKEVLKKVVEYIGPTLRPVDLFRFYVYPTNQNDLEDLTLLFEDCLLPREGIERLGRTWIHPADHSLGHQFENVPEAAALLPGGARDTLEKFNAERVRLAARGLHSPVDTPEDPNRLLTSCKAYWKASLQDMEDEEGRTGEEPQWYQVVLTGDESIVLQCREVVFWDREPSYLCPKFVEVIDEFYGYGLPGVFDSLHYFANDILNQGGDCLTFSLNPIAGVDPSAVQDMTSVRMRPGAKWLVRKPRENITFIEPPKESAAVAMQAVQTLVALINDVANVAPFSGTNVGRSKGRALQTAGGMQLVVSENLVQVHDVIQGIEDLWLDRMLRKMYSRTQQCLDVPVLLNIEGAAGAALVQRQIRRDDLIGEYTYRWLASAATYNLQVRAQQMISFLQIVARIPPPLLQQQNITISWKFLLRSIWGDGFALPEPEKLIQEGSPVRALDPELENELFRVGRGDDVHVSPADKDMEHLKEHEKLLKPGVLPNDLQPPIVQHMQEHFVAMMTKHLMQTVGPQGAAGMAGLPPGAAGMLGGGPGGPGNGAAPGGPGNEAGSGDLAMPDAPGRVSATNDMGDVMRRMGRQPGGIGGPLQ